MSIRIGVDLGGSKIEAIALNEQGRVLIRNRITTPRNDYRATLDAIQKLVCEIERQLDTQATVGIGTPGAISPANGLIKNANSTCLIGKPLDKDLAQLLGREIKIANDADCFALSEATDGAGAGAHSVFGIILGTGVGAGIVINGQLLSGPNAIAGEWGHNPLPWPSEQERFKTHCYCGQQDCIETWLSGPGFADQAIQQFSVQGSCEYIWQLASQGHAQAVQATDRYIDQLARALASVINILDPQVIILGGGLSNVEQLYQKVPQRWGRYIFTDKIYTQLVPAKYGDASGVRGAAWLWN